MNDHPEAVTELNLQMTGSWLVTTESGSTYAFNLDEGTVARTPGAGAASESFDRIAILRTISFCRIGERGYWTMSDSTDRFDYLWRLTTRIVSIEPATDG
jgi:hypothetical protein